MAGTISVLNKELGEIALGSQFQEDVIMVISDLDGMEALVDVDENDIVAVSLGDSARIEVDALPDDLFAGVVTEIANSAKITGQGSADQKTEFEVKISIVNPGNKLRPGMTASSDIVTEVNDNALAIPIQCVAVRTLQQLHEHQPVNRGDSAAIADDTPKTEYKPDKDGFCEIVFVVADGKVKARQVKTGIQSDTHIEIREGLQVDDVVVTGSYRAISKDLQNGAEVSIDNKKDVHNRN
jgi:HlyD family secretion protein